MLMKRETRRNIALRRALNFFKSFFIIKVAVKNEVKSFENNDFAQYVQNHYINQLH